MSTDIIRYSTDPTSGVSEEEFSLAALRLYMSITLPMMAMTFAAWYCMYWWVNSKEHVKFKREKIARIGGEV
jgi:hypothetical protein